MRVTIGALAGWVMWAGVTYLLGTRVWPEAQTRTDMGELLRVIGFSYAPHFFSIFGVLPGVGSPDSRIAVDLWLLATTVVAVRQALDYRSTFRAFRVVVVGLVDLRRDCMGGRRQVTLHRPGSQVAGTHWRLSHCLRN